ncbi:hypothetical protein Sste5346_001770 [Sporothrix stenoceras]|uniref:Rhodopsin domain-containing protein n=1 Tax=Sporothrix stenoceras TaxID=5173 RepID=A0ABR3ZMS2_9PEZI
MQRPPAQLLSWPSLHLAAADTATRGPAVLILLSILLSITTLLVGVRIYTRCRITHGFGSDDVLILMAFTIATAFSAAGIAGEQTLQWGQHVWGVLPSSFIPGLKLTLAMQVLFDVATNLTKLSMLALFIRITHASGQHAARRMALCLAAIVLASATIFLLVDIFQCRPVSAYWTLSAQRQCINQASHLLAAGTINTVADLVIAIVFPIQYWSAVDQAKAVAKSASDAAKQPDTPWSRGHNRSKNRSESSTLSSSASSASLVRGTRVVIAGPTLKRKRFNFCLPPAVVTSLFVGGMLVVAAGTARTVFTWQTMTSTDGDVTWNSAPALMASALELDIAIIVASVPPLKPFFCRFLPDRYTAAHSRLSRGHMQRQSRSEKRVAEASVSPLSLSSLRSILFRTKDSTDSEIQRPPLDLNKPLPTLQRGQDDTQTVVEVVEPARPGTYYSVYDFQADADGYIRVRKASADTPMPELGMAI